MKFFKIMTFYQNFPMFVDNGLEMIIYEQFIVVLLELNQCTTVS